MPGANKLVWSAENEQKLLLAIYVTHNIDFHKVAVVFGEADKNKLRDHLHKLTKKMTNPTSKANATPEKVTPSPSPAEPEGMNNKRKYQVIHSSEESDNKIIKIPTKKQRRVKNQTSKHVDNKMQKSEKGTDSELADAFAEQDDGHKPLNAGHKRQAKSERMLIHSYEDMEEAEDDDTSDWGNYP